MHPAAGLRLLHRTPAVTKLPQYLSWPYLHLLPVRNYSIQPGKKLSPTGHQKNRFPAMRRPPQPRPLNRRPIFLWNLADLYNNGTLRWASRFSLLPTRVPIPSIASTRFTRGSFYSSSSPVRTGLHILLPHLFSTPQTRSCTPNC